MTVLTFPSNPTVGQQYAAPNGIQYVFDGVKWIVETTSSSSEAVSNSTQDRVAPMFVDGDNTGITFSYNAATNTMSAEVTSVNGDSVVNGAYNITLDTTGDFVPSTDNLQDLGSPTNRFRHLYVGPGSVYIGNNVITEAATGSLVLPGFTRATGYYADEVDDDEDWGSNPNITGTVTVIDASRYRILAGRPASANYSPATYTVQKDGNRIDEINVSNGGSGWDKVEADYARDNNMYATNVVGAINNFNAGNWQQIPFRVEIKAEDTEYEDIFGGGADLGDLVIYDGAITTDGVSSIVIAPNGEGYGYITVPNDTSAVAGAATVIGNSRNGGGGVQIAAYNNTWTFGPDGDLTLPAGGDILNSNGDSVLGGGSTSYTPDDTDNWNEPTINTISAALDELAARVTALQNFEIDGGNANTPALGELLIDGNGA